MLINTYCHNNLFWFNATNSNMHIQCFYNQTMKNVSSVSTWIPIPLILFFETTNSSPEALSYINTVFSYRWIYLIKTHKHAHTRTETENLSKNKGQKNQRLNTEGRLNQCNSLQVAPFPCSPVMLHTALSSTSIPLVASLCLPAGVWCANLLRVWVVVLIICAQRHGHGWFSHTVQLTANWHGCSLLLLLLLLLLSGLQPSLLLQSSTIPQADVGNTDKLASLIWINSLKKRRGAGKHGANGRPLCIRICAGGVCLYPMRRENVEMVLSYS